MTDHEDTASLWPLVALGAIALSGGFVALVFVSGADSESLEAAANNTTTPPGYTYTPVPVWLFPTALVVAVGIGGAVTAYQRLKN